jgi:hypothetical protein
MISISIFQRRTAEFAPANIIQVMIFSGSPKQSSRGFNNWFLAVDADQPEIRVRGYSRSGIHKSPEWLYIITTTSY